MREDNYEFNVGEKGQEGLDILDAYFNENTQQKILAAGLKPGMKVLDIGCGRGVMSLWFANQVGSTGQVLAIDNSENQIKATVELTKKVAPNWLQFRLFSAYDIDKLQQSFDMAYCRFILHHVNNPTQIIEKIFNALPKGGLLIAEEGIVSAAFAWPRKSTWAHERDGERYALEKEGENRDGNFGMKLAHQMSTVGFEIEQASLYQPLLYTQQQKQLLAGPALADYKKFAIEHGMSEADWDKQERELHELIASPAGCIGFYQSCLVVGRKA